MLNSESRILIVGQGIAGTIVSFKLLQKGISHKVIDNKHKYAATKAAAGIINPITGRNYVKSWMIDDLLPVAKSTYREVSKVLSFDYIRETTILRALHTPAQENKWFSAISKPGYADYIIDNTTPSKAYSHITQTASQYGQINQSFQVAIDKLITDYKKHLADNNNYIESNFMYELLSIHDNHVQYNNNPYDYIIFCEGYKGMENPFFADLPFQPAKGESFILEIEESIPDEILRDEIFLATIGGQSIWSGGSYRWDFEDDRPTDSFSMIWKEKLDKLLIVDYNIIEHRAGVRPAVKGRKPLIGTSSESNRLLMFNGMGTKATSLVPYWADHLLQHLMEGSPIDDQVNLSRFLFK